MSNEADQADSGAPIAKTLSLPRHRAEAMHGIGGPAVGATRSPITEKKRSSTFAAVRTSHHSLCYTNLNCEPAKSAIFVFAKVTLFDASSVMIVSAPDCDILLCRAWKSAKSAMLNDIVSVELKPLT